jgi:hypothetical protein
MRWGFVGWGTNQYRAVVSVLVVVSTPAPIIAEPWQIVTLERSCAEKVCFISSLGYYSPPAIITHSSPHAKVGH